MDKFDKKIYEILESFIENNEGVEQSFNNIKKSNEIFGEEKSFKINDIVEYELNNCLQKAVITAIGKSGITGRDKNQNRVRLFYKDIKNHISR